MKPEEFGSYFDHTLLKPYATIADFEAFCQEGLECCVKALMVNPAAVILCKRLVENCGVSIGTTVGFPLGQATVEAKKFEAIDAIHKGSNEIDYVINIAEVKNNNYNYIKEEMKAMVFICQEMGAVSKAIFENCYLTDEEKKALCDTASEAGPDFIKTSTGFGTGGATLQDVKLMREYTVPSVKIKASSGIRTLNDAITMIEAGAERIGTSLTPVIIEEFLSSR